MAFNDVKQECDSGRLLWGGRGISGVRRRATSADSAPLADWSSVHEASQRYEPIQFVVDQKLQFRTEHLRPSELIEPCTPGNMENKLTEKLVVMKKIIPPREAGVAPAAVYLESVFPLL